VSILLSKEGVKITKNSQIIYISRSRAFFAHFVPIWLGFFGLIWLIIKAFTSGFIKKILA